MEQDPVRAGRAAVLVNVNDIYAMGGRPLALVNVLAGVDERQIESLSQGIREECRRLQVPMVGGH
ncbi:MAG: AIR synthase related protein, partial [Thermodesulfobacteriota bacterium]